MIGYIWINKKYNAGNHESDVVFFNVKTPIPAFPQGGRSEKKLLKLIYMNLR